MVVTMNIIEIKKLNYSFKDKTIFENLNLNIKKDRSVVMLLNAIERSDEIDFKRANESRIRAEERLNSEKEDIDVARAKAALARSLNRLSLEDK